MAIVAKELNPHNYPTTPEVDACLKVLLEKMNKVRTLWAKPMIVTSGLRSEADQKRINPSASKSKHLLGQACDISDPKQELATWVKANLDKMTEIGLWMEDFDSTPTWCHFQIVPPKSGNRVFKP